MEATTQSGNSIRGLFRGLTGDTRTLVRQEIQLAKTEISEKISHLGRQGVILAAGAFVAYAGLIVFLSGLGWLAAWLLARWGLQPILAAFVGLAAVGFLVTLLGGLLLLKAVRAMSSQSLKPQRTLQSLQELKNGQPPDQPRPSAQPSPAPAEQPGVPPSSQQLQARVEATENRLGTRLGELGQRLNPKQLNLQVKRRLQAQPYSAGLLALGLGFIGGLWLTRKTH